MIPIRKQIINNKQKGATQKIFLEFGLFFFYRNNNRQQPENCNRLLFFL